jgi:hypothetical protein
VFTYVGVYAVSHNVHSALYLALILQ